MRKVDGVWTDYQPWSSCSASCGAGTQARSKYCGSAQFGGTQTCSNPGETQEDYQDCSGPTCAAPGIINLPGIII